MIHKYEILKTSPIFVDFIKSADRNDWVQAVKRTEMNKVFNVIQENGEMDVRLIDGHY